MMYLIGMNNENEIIFAEPELRNGEFACSFDVVHPFVLDDGEIDDRCESYFDCIDAKSKLDICERLHCAPQDIVDNLEDDEKFELAYDTSLYPSSVICDDGNEWYFESSYCGQHDVRKDGIKNLVINNNIFDELMRLWDNYHLKKLPETEIKVYDSIIRELEEVSEDEETLIRDMIEENIINVQEATS